MTQRVQVLLPGRASRKVPDSRCNDKTITRDGSTSAVKVMRPQSQAPSMCMVYLESSDKRSVTPNVGIQRLQKAVRCNDGLGVIGLALGLHPSSIGEHDRGFNLPRRDRPVCSEQAILISV